MKEHKNNREHTFFTHLKNEAVKIEGNLIQIHADLQSTYNGKILAYRSFGDSLCFLVYELSNVSLWILEMNLQKLQCGKINHHLCTCKYIFIFIHLVFLLLLCISSTGLCRDFMLFICDATNFN